MKTIRLVLLSVTVLCLLLSCSSKIEPVETDVKTKAITEQPMTTENETDNHYIVNGDQFEYTINDDGTLTLTKYKGTDTDIIFPSAIDGKTVSTIGDRIFSLNQNIVSIDMPDTILKIGTSAFRGCTKLANIKFSKNLEIIGQTSFSLCSSLTELIIPDSVVTIGEGAFENCRSLLKVTLNEGLTELGSFNDCKSLEEINIPNTVGYIGNATFQNCQALKSIHIPSSCKYIGENAFYHSGLENVDLDEGIEKILYGAFASTNLKTVTIPGSVKKIESTAFSSCKDLTEIMLNKGIEEIQYNAFGETAIKEIVLPESLQKLDEMAFAGCLALKRVKFEGNAPELTIDAGIQVGDINYKILYHENATGFNSEKYNNYQKEIW